MEQVILFAVLGLGAGAAYALVGLGVALTFRGSGTLAFSHGAVAMAAAFTFNALAGTALPLALAALITVGASTCFGVLVYFAVIRPLRAASALAQLITTIGLLIALNAIAELIWAKTVLSTAAPPSLMPSSTVSIFGVAFGVDRLCLVGVVALATGALSFVYRVTRFGRMTRAAAESERSAALLGTSPDRIAAANWALGSGLAGLAGILVAPITSLNIMALTFMILPGLAAALVGRFQNFGVIAVAGLMIGVGQSLITRFWAVQGMDVALPFVVVVAVLAFAGSRIPVRGDEIGKRPPLAARGEFKLSWAIAVPLVAVLALVLLGDAARSAITASMIGALVALSLVAVAGYVGQANLAPLTFAALGAFGTSFLGHSLGLPFPLPVVLSAVIAALCGVLIGLPALRVRGIALAVMTLGIGIAVDAVVFQNYAISGGSSGRLIPTPKLGSFSLDTSTHPIRFAIFVLIVLCVLAVMVSTIRRSRVGRQMLAVRWNERAAAAAGINVSQIKLYAFGISAFIGGVAGSLIAYQAGATSASNFTPVLSLAAVATAYIGGIAAVSGAFTAGLLVNGGVVYALLNQIGGISTYWTAVLGVSLVVTVVLQPDGIALKNIEIKNAVRAWLRARRRRAAIGGIALPHEQGER